MTTTLYAVQGDNKAVRTVVLRNGPLASSTPIDLTTATAVQLNATGPATLTKACTFVADATGTVTVTLLTADLATPGGYQIEWQVTFADSTVITVPSPGTDSLKIRPQGG